MKFKMLRTFLVLTVLLVTIVPTALADNGTDSSALRAAVTTAGMSTHLAAFQLIADNNNDTRVAASFGGHEDSAAYVQQLMTAAGYNVTSQTFTYDFFQEFDTPVLDPTAPDLPPYPPYDVTGFATMEYSGSNDVTALVVPTNDLVIPPGATDNTSNSGCEASDFPGTVSGNIALIQRGTCPFGTKAANALAAGAVGVIIFNEGQPGRTDAFIGTLGGTVSATLPVVGAAFSVGEQLYNLSQQPGGVTARMFTSTTTTPETTRNIIAETPSGRTDRVVVVGAHLDSVAEGPGINDNGSGSAALLEIALQMAELGIQPRNQVRFIWFSAEEAGLIGSQFYVDGLSTRQIKDIAVMLNFDMIGSPNYARFVYDGDGSGFGTAGPNGSDVIEDVFLEYFASQSLTTAPTAFDGRSDYFAFINAGIPAGGLFTGAEGINPANNTAYDPCYHQFCDDIDNVNSTALDEMSDAAALTILTFAMTTSAVNGTDKGKGRDQADLEYLGSNLRK
jgi:Zn-dependent M28 family amino/carboxypeptidase